MQNRSQIPSFYVRENKQSQFYYRFATFKVFSAGQPAAKLGQCNNGLRHKSTTTLDFHAQLSVHSLRRRFESQTPTLKKISKKKKDSDSPMKGRNMKNPRHNRDKNIQERRLSFPGKIQPTISFSTRVKRGRCLVGEKILKKKRWDSERASGRAGRRAEDTPFLRDLWKVLEKSGTSLIARPVCFSPGTDLAEFMSTKSS